jgi:four helix bundle protein
LVIDLLIGFGYFKGVHMSAQSEALKERTMSFAINVLRLIDRFPQTPGAKVIAYQLAKCSTSVGANYRAVCNARSRAEFVAKLGTVVEEAEESVYWLARHPQSTSICLRPRVGRPSAGINRAARDLLTVAGNRA